MKIFNLLKTSGATSRHDIHQQEASDLLCLSHCYTTDASCSQTNLSFPGGISFAIAFQVSPGKCPRIAEAAENGASTLPLFKALKKFTEILSCYWFDLHRPT